MTGEFDKYSSNRLCEVPKSAQSEIPHKSMLHTFDTDDEQNTAQKHLPVLHL